MTLALVLLAAAATAQAQLPELRLDGAPVSIAQARVMSAPALASRLLLPGGDPVVETIVHPQGWDPPLPPGGREYSIDLITVGRRGGTEAFCNKRIISVVLKGAPNTGHDSLVGSATGVSSTEAFRLADRSRGPSAGCDGPLSGYFRPPAADAALAKAHVLTLSRARTDARRRRHLSFAFSFDDRLPTLEIGPPPERFAEAREALAALPIEDAGFVGDARRAETPLQPQDLVDQQGRALEAVQFYIRDVWSVGMVLDGDRIVLLRIVRANPAPF